jgi:hypothetical protein
MSVRVESPPIRGSFNGPIVIAIIVALGIGIFAGTVITKVVEDRPEAATTSLGAQVWDAQKLQAMEGRVLAERFRGSQPVTWDVQKLAAMAGRVMYQPVATEPEVVMTAKPAITQRPKAPVLWDEGKLEAMAGRVLAAGVGAEDPPVKPHVPKRPPR